MVEAGIVIIDGVKYRMVDRKAAVGERVIVTGESCACYHTGELAKVISSNGRVAFVDLTENTNYYDDGKWYIDRKDYRVLEPITSAEPAPVSEPLSAKPAPDQAAEIIAKLTGRVAALEKRVAALEKPAEVTKTSSGEVADSLSAILTKGERITPLKSAREIRDDIVKRAKEDVADLLGKPSPFTHELVALDGAYIEYHPNIHNVEFVINHDKRTVVALIRLRKSGKLRLRGIAKCAPGDVFNAALGRAISLRRALGLEIPEEYVSAPQPTEVRVGDIVKYASGGVKIVVEDNATFDPYVETRIKLALIRGTVIDDSRESDSAEPRKEVA
ncbi:hypothetical protein [Paenibacillus sp. FSL R5-0519]|uniref:hypothetical protein n=1 Tax=Paenibacillus sp. FSL R5-0519 TaxID=2921648 RepID=UPI0030DD8060